MRILREALGGVIAAFSTSLLVIGAVLLGVTEGMMLPAPQPSQAATLPPELGTLFPGFTTPTPRPTQPRLVAVPTQEPGLPCETVPAGWEKYVVLAGDTLNALAQAHAVDKDAILKANCMDFTSLSAGMLLYLPPIPPTVTPTPLPPTATAEPGATRAVIPCGPPPGWVKYTVQPGDTLYRLHFVYNVAVATLRVANCLADDTIRLGKTIYVPNVAPRYTPTRPLPPPTQPPVIVPTAIRTATATFTATATPVTPTRTFTSTLTATVPEDTFTPTFTATFTATITPTPSFTPSPTATFTFTPTGTETPTETSTSTSTEIPNP